MHVDSVPTPPYSSPVLLVDVFMGSVVGLLLTAGAKEVWISRSIRAARIQAGENGLLLGELEGLPPEGFSHGTSLKALERLEVRHKSCVILAPALAYALQYVPNGSLLAYFRNAKAAITNGAKGSISRIVAIGDDNQPNLANSVAAGFIAKRLSQIQGNTLEGSLAASLLKSYPDPQEALFQSSIGQQLYRTNRTEDLALASLVSVEETVPKLVARLTLSATEHGLSKDRHLYCFRADKL